MNRRVGSLAIVVALATACGEHDEGGLDPESVMNLPPGDAQGSAASGSWHFESYTSACAGLCAAGSGALVISFCDVGDRDESDAEATQADGALRIDADDSLFVSRLEGGIDADGAFDIGGYGTEYGGQLGITARVQGTIDGDEVSGTAQLHLLGANEDGAIDCHATYDLDGERD